ncbi:TetR/AcrR family transcriptional regulator [Acidovorax sp. A1169]|uniref:TetR/AcrR family transcriptional regulator n=1 Tax=Acidovorax sp. A1169 TaxID=3059524 RepID=UPI00273793B1|nr:TetR/AcrR family transcriptional regulator [Acidovorax sp. A1169]MDP4075720.1 TetR/AcrR family transcriptional regulator [Acidovorax sp. A1169]
MDETVQNSPPSASDSRPARQRAARAAAATPGAERVRVNDPDRTMANILQVATAEFADKGLAGARIDEIAALTSTSKRMIYYYFGSKEGLYVKVLEEAYRRIRQIESELHLEDLAPEQALRTLVGFTFDYQLANPDFIRLVMNENMHRGEYISRSTTIQELNIPVIHAVHKVYQRGVAAGVFRPDVDPVDLHMSISALCFFNVSNRHTFGAIFKRTLDSPAAMAERRESIVEMIVRFLRP